MQAVKRYAFNLLSAISLLLFFVSVYLLARSWIVRDEISIGRHNIWVVAVDSGRFELASASCSIGIPTSTGFALSLTKGAATAYSPTLQFRYKATAAGTDQFWEPNRFGTDDRELYYYGKMDASGTHNLGPSPLVLDVTSVTLPLPGLTFLFAVAPLVWRSKARRRRRDAALLALQQSVGVENG
jgi:hypothetical protein